MTNPTLKIHPDAFDLVSELLILMKRFDKPLTTGELHDKTGAKLDDIQTAIEHLANYGYLDQIQPLTWKLTDQAHEYLKFCD